jgi:hypothetical protein
VEGGLRAPALAGAQESRYLQRAMGEGRGSNGQSLHPLMPRYRFDAATLDDLQAYLAVIGSDTPGLSESAVRIGVMLPPTVYGAAVQAGLSEAFDQVVVYGRRLQLVVNAPTDDVFAEVGNMVNSADNVARDSDSPPELGPLSAPGFANYADPTAPGRFLFLPSVGEQAKMFLAQVAFDDPVKKAAGRLLLVHETENDRTLDPMLDPMLDALREQARIERMQMREQIDSTKPPMPGETAIYIGDGAHLREFLDAGGVGLVYADALAAGPAVMHLPPAQARRLRLLLPWRTAQASFDLATAYRDAGYASGLVLIEALKRCGRQFGRAQFVQQLENLRNFPVQAFGTIEFRPDQPYGGHAAQWVEADLAQGKFSVLRTVSAN